MLRSDLPVSSPPLPLTQADRGNRAFFRANQAIFIPSAKQRVKTADSIWQSHVPLRHHCTLSSEYPPTSERFFKYCLNIPDANIRHVVEELKSWSHKEDTELAYLKSLVMAMVHLQPSSNDRLDASTLSTSMTKLRGLPIIPVVKVAGSQVVRETASLVDQTKQWFVADMLRLKEAFREHVWLADFDPDESLKLSKWLKSISKYFPQARPALSQVVTEKLEHGKIGAAVIFLTDLLHLRASSLGCVAEKDSGGRRSFATKLLKLRSASVRATSNIVTRYSILHEGKRIIGKPEQKADIMLEEESDALKIFVSDRVAAQQRMPPGTEEWLCRFFGLTDDNNKLLVHQIFTAWSVEDVRDLLVKHDIPLKYEESRDTTAASGNNDNFIGPKSTAVATDGAGSTSRFNGLTSTANNTRATRASPVTRPVAMPQTPQSARIQRNEVQQDGSETSTIPEMAKLSLTGRPGGSSQTSAHVATTSLHRSCNSCRPPIYCRWEWTASYYRYKSPHRSAEDR